MFPTPALPTQTVLMPFVYRYGSHRFKAKDDKMDRVSPSSFSDGTTIKPPSSEASTTPRTKKRPSHVKPANCHSSYLTSGLKRHFDTTQFSDLIVRCRDDEYQVHRVIMCSHSQWFAKVCAAALAETTTQTIDLSADNPEAVDAMLQYCYELDYADKFLGMSSAGYTIYTLTPHIDIYLLAERYSIPGLKQLAVEKFEVRAAVLARVELNKDRFFQAIRIIYASTRPSNDDLRRVTVRLCADHAEQYILQGGKTATRVFKLMDEIPSFRMEFIKELASRLK